MGVVIIRFGRHRLVKNAYDGPLAMENGVFLRLFWEEQMVGWGVSFFS